MAAFVVAYHQSAGGPWSEMPSNWLDESIKRDFLSFLRAKNAGNGDSPDWQVVRQMLKVRKAFRELSRNLRQCTVLGRQAVMMFVGAFSDKLRLPFASGQRGEATLVPSAHAHPHHLAPAVAEHPEWYTSGEARDHHRFNCASASPLRFAL